MALEELVQAPGQNPLAFLLILYTPQRQFRLCLMQHCRDSSAIPPSNFGRERRTLNGVLAGGP